MASTASRQALSLDTDWHIVVFVVEASAAGFAATWSDVERFSVGTRMSVLAQDTEAVRAVLEGTNCEVSYTLPEAVESESLWVALLGAHTFDANRTVFASAGARLPPAWDARLVAAAQASARSCAVAPLLAQHAQLSVFTDASRRPVLSVDDVDQWLNDYSPGGSFSMPDMPTTCLVLQGDVWRQCQDAAFADDTALLRPLREAGYWFTASAQLFVDDSLCPPAVASRPPVDPSAEVAFSTRHPLAGLRHALTELDERAEKPAGSVECLPVQLHVGHSWGGGLNRWIANYLANDTSCHHLVLRSIGDISAFGQQVALYRGADMSVPLRTFVLAQPILSTVVSQMEYAQLLDEVIREFNVESLMISSFIGHSLDLLDTGLPTTIVQHDFFPFCPALYACFDSPCQRCDLPRLEQCRAQNPVNAFFLHEDSYHWSSLRETFFAKLEVSQPTLIAPSQSVLDRYTQLEPRVSALTTHVIPHGLDDALVDHFAAHCPPAPEAGSRLKVLVLGRMTAEKGADLLYQVIPRIAAFADCVLLGAGSEGERFAALENCEVIDDYELDGLPEQIAAVAPDLAMLLSVVPETFSYTLSEVWALGLPVVASNMGAFADRVTHGHNGWLVEPQVDAVVDSLAQLHADRSAIATVTQSVRSQPVVRATEMVAQYIELSPVAPAIPARRYHLPRRSFQNPYAQAGAGDTASLFLERTRGVEATYRSVLKEFLQYTEEKLVHTRRMPGMLRAVVSRLLRVVGRRL